MGEYFIIICCRCAYSSHSLYCLQNMCSSENENPTSANPCIVVFEFCADACLLPRQYFIVSTLVKFVNLTGMGLHRTIWLELTLMPVNQQQRPNRLLHLKILKHRHHRKGQFPNWMEIKKQPEMFQRTSYSINGGRTYMSRRGSIAMLTRTFNLYSTRDICN